MSDRDDYDADPIELETGRNEYHDEDLAGASLALQSRSSCDNGGCLNPLVHATERPWVDLASPVPKSESNGEFPLASDLFSDVECPGASLASMVHDALRPSGIEDFSIEKIRTAWQDLAATHLAVMPGLLKTKLAELARTWEGDDFDAFAEQVEETQKALLDLLDDIGQAIVELYEAEELIYYAQGGGGPMPYPAANVWKAGSSAVNKSKIHVRPAWFSGGCPRDRSAGTVWQMLGLDTDLYAMFDEYVYTRANNLLIMDRQRGGSPPMTEQQALDRAIAEYEEPFENIFEHFSKRQQRAADNHNQAINGRVEMVRGSQERPELDSTRVTPSTIADQDGLDFDQLDLDRPPPPGPMPSPDLDAFDPPTMTPIPSELQPPQPDSPWDGSLLTPTLSDPADLEAYKSGLGQHTGGGGSLGSASGSGGGSPWSLSGMDDDERRGGLASAGGLGGAGTGGLGGGLGAANAAGAGAGSGLGGAGMMGAGGAGAGRGAGGGRGTGQGRGGRGGGMMGSGAGRGGQGGDSDGGDRETLLVEDEDVWGIGNAEDDPYA